MSRPRTLLLTIDAFDTIFYPRHPIPDQYASVAHAFNLPRSTVTPARIQSAFKSVYKEQSRLRPNYGRADVLRGQYGGPRQWWEEVMRGCFKRVLAKSSTSTGEVHIPDGLFQSLLDRFASREGYALYEDAGVFFERLKDVRRGVRGLGVFERVVVGVVSNSDDRVPAVLRSLGLKVGGVRADEGIESLSLPGFEQRNVTTTNAVLDGDNGEDATVNDVDLVITSYEAGEEKPSPVIFDVAERQARRLVGNDQEGDWVRVHVGDDYDKDYRAAVDAGWKGLYLPRGGGALETRGGEAIRSLVDLIPVLEGYR
ncbi:putative haloacid dehalogenase-like hydrolase [Aspergillus sclerotioniger CBS 115572]|uniref:Putative haloacid dehalogenase-like hydrolase n=1 Tax=Aspergillus sclerotioniger CBS 115572 TaxID=1450535 RepID=A0A317XDE7_9EURO|nr:putative haloacid dehalogenase-like hydrolase [Aspergillus sclerotioniger CBS 115572]PWY96559.1 putative haloacid dehalogenase-like hydrolase [Aspergillus sclerotioniger CBS 115572]